MYINYQKKDLLIRFKVLTRTFLCSSVHPTAVQPGEEKTPQSLF
jgi:hypothetical protein